MKISAASLHSMQKKQLGYSIVEWMIVIALTLFLSAGVFSVFISSQRATTVALDSDERQENAAFALQILTRDLKQAYFFAGATGDNADIWDLNVSSLASSADCLDNNGNGSFPTAGIYRPLWASTVPANISDLEMDCLDDGDSATTLISEAGFIAIKRVRGLAQDDDFDSDGYYLDINATQITVYSGDASHLNAVEAGTEPAVWQYIHHVYYLDKAADIPRLRRMRLVKDKMLDEVLVEGIENMQFTFVLDELLSSERDGAVHAIAETESVTDNDWDTGRVIGVKIYLLARSLEPTAGYVNNNTYQLGNKTFIAPGDAYKRELLSAVVAFPNNMVLVDD